MWNKILKMSNGQRFCLEQEMHTVMGEATGCALSVFSDTSSVRVGLYLPLADNFSNHVHPREICFCLS